MSFYEDDMMSSPSKISQGIETETETDIEILVGGLNDLVVNLKKFLKLSVAS
jgi:hypothetical protein